jgi:hypothetical protein
MESIPPLPSVVGSDTDAAAKGAVVPTEILIPAYYEDHALVAGGALSARVNPGTATTKSCELPMSADTPTQCGSSESSIQTERSYTLSFDLKGWSASGWRNIVHFTGTGIDCCSSGDRVPGVWYHGGTSKLHIRQSNAGSGCCNNGYDGPSAGLNYYKWTTVRISMNALEGQMYVSYVSPDADNPVSGVVIGGYSTVAASTRWSADVYGSDPWYDPGEPGFSFMRSMYYYKWPDGTSAAAGNSVETYGSGTYLLGGNVNGVNIHAGKHIATLTAHENFVLKFQVKPEPWATNLEKRYSNIVTVVKGFNLGTAAQSIPTVHFKGCETASNCGRLSVRYCGEPLDVDWIRLKENKWTLVTIKKSGNELSVDYNRGDSDNVEELLPSDKPASFADGQGEVKKVTLDLTDCSVHDATDVLCGGNGRNTCKKADEHEVWVSDPHPETPAAKAAIKHLQYYKYT